MPTVAAALAPPATVVQTMDASNTCLCREDQNKRGRAPKVRVMICTSLTTRADHRLS